jgi:hypothetical protein
MKWSSILFGPNTFLDTDIFGPRKFGSQETWFPRNLYAGTEFLGPKISWDKISWDPKEIGDQFSISPQM